MDSDQHTQYLIIQTASIGDVILSTAILEKLHQEHPLAKIDLLVKKGCEGLFTEHPFLNRLLIWDKSQYKYRNLRILLKDIRAHRYNAVINLHRFAASGILTAFSRAKYKAGFSKNPLSRFFHLRVQHVIGGPQPKHEVDRNQALLEKLAPGKAGPVRLYPTAEDQSAVKLFQNTPYITIAPLSLWFTKQYPAEMWKSFVDELKGSMRIYFLGSDKEKAKIDQIFGHPINSENLAGKLSLLQTAALMKSAAMNFTNDSAPLHLASAMDANVTAIFCSTIPDFGFGPLTSHGNIIQTEETLSCRPCGIHGKKECPEKHMKCGTGIPVSKLINCIPHA